MEEIIWEVLIIGFSLEIALLINWVLVKGQTKTWEKRMLKLWGFLIPSTAFLLFMSEMERNSTLSQLFEESAWWLLALGFGIWVLVELARFFGRRQILKTN